MSKFNIGQLVCATNLPEDHYNHADIGRLTSIDEEGNCTVTNYEGDSFVVPESSLKQAVHFDVDKPHSYEIDTNGHVYAIDHPDPFIPAGEFVITSTVLQSPKEGFFETRNTVYMVNKIYPFGKGYPAITSPYLMGNDLSLPMSQRAA